MSTAVRLPSAALGVRPAGRLRRRVRENVTAYGLLCAALLVFAGFSWYPIVRGILLSFQQVNFVSAPTWVGLENFQKLFADPQFGEAWLNTLLFTALALVFGFAVPFAVAVLLNELRHGKGYFRLVVYLPVMLPPVVVALLWKWFYDPGPGLFNTALHAVGLPGLAWLNSPTTAMLSLVLVSTWANMGSATLIYLAALQTIPGDLYEAADVDGAGPVQKFLHVTLPQLRPVIISMAVLDLIWTSQQFALIWMTTGGGPLNTTEMLSTYTYKQAFSEYEFATASAAAVVVLMLTMILAFFYVRQQRER